MTPPAKDSSSARLELYWPDPKTGPYLVGITFDLVEDRLEVVGVEIWGREPTTPEWMNSSPAGPAVPITSTAIRLPLERLATESIRRMTGAAHLIKNRPERFTKSAQATGEKMGRLKKTQQVGRPPIYGREHFEAVAAVYNEALANHQNPTLEVAAHFGVSKSAAAKWVHRCRDDDLRLLPATSRGRSAGTRKTPNEG